MVFGEYVVNVVVWRVFVGDAFGLWSRVRNSEIRVGTSWNHKVA